jgi:hypothetical protein
VQRSVARSAQDQKSTKCRRNPSEEEFAEVGQDKGLRSIQEEPKETRTVDLRRDTHQQIVSSKVNCNWVSIEN